MIVMKFGGSSVASADRIRHVAAIVANRRQRRPVVVVSAMGKTTDRLLEIAGHAVAGRRDKALELLRALEQFHLEEGGSLDGRVEGLFVELSELVRGLAMLGELTPRSIDAISSYGERLSSLIVAEAFRQAGLGAVHVDSREVIVTDSRHTQASPLFDETYSRLQAAIPPLAGKRVVVMGGFIASDRNGVTTTLGRGGSDFTASIAGAGIGAEEIQIWTDVDGILTADPRVVKGVHRVKVISFEEAAELAYFGARVLHPATVLPAIEKNIPVLVLNSYRPEVDGTRIVADRVPCTNVVKSISTKRNITVVNITSTRMVGTHGFLRRIFEIFDRNETSVDMVSTSEVSVSATIDRPAELPKIRDELEAFSQVDVEENQAIICLVGDNIRYTPGVSGRVFKALNGVNIRMISQGASLLNLGFVVAAKDVERALEALHAEFFSELDPQVFE
ncbi:MAG: lysine-sensitive aspartokinase 3 [Bryobacteraceae bacterium]|nr:lysine-sensitive aspartokinase 3 [Bryobacteraceae bacterium]